MWITVRNDFLHINSYISISQHVDLQIEFRKPVDTVDPDYFADRN